MENDLQMLITKEFRFDSAHNLLNYKGKCENLHGHTYRLKVTLEGKADTASGMIIDFGDLKKIVEEKVINRLDHAYINNIVQISTAENIISWIWKELEGPFAGQNHRLHELVLWETPGSSVTLRRD